MEFTLGLISGCLLALLIVGFFAANVPFEHKRIEDCRRETGAYQCELVAVPVAAPTWVPQK